MKLVQTEKTLQTNADFVSQDFTIGDVSVVIEILRNKMYRHKVRTLVQEYISNARDAMREINSKERVEISLPTIFQPTFKVRDFGPGINPDRMYNVFIKYAASTKRDSNKQTGGFGIGAKSAWSYTESFTIVTFIDGTQRTYVAHIGANNNGRLDFLGESPTNAANGTEIQIPVNPKDINEFKQSTYRAVYFWNDAEKPIFKNVSQDEIVNYVQGEMIDNLEINNNIPECIVSKYDTGVIISIDGIPYVADQNLMRKVPSFQKASDAIVGRLIIHIPNGELEVAASREEISDSKFTLENLEQIGQTAYKVINARIIKEFSKVKTPFEHLSMYMSLKDKYNLESYRQYGDFTVNDKNGIESELFQNVKLEICTIVADKLCKDGLRKGRRNWHRKTNIKAELFNSLYFNDGTETALISNYRIKSYLTTNPTLIVVTKQADDQGQFDKLKVGLGLKDLKSVSYVKPARQTRESIKVERTKQEFVLWNMSKYSHQATNTSLETNDQKWLYVERTNTLNNQDHQDLSQYLENKGYKVCALSKENIRRVKGDKNFKPLDIYLKNYKVTTEDIVAMKAQIAKNSTMMSKLSKLTGIKDKFLIKMIAEYKSHKVYSDGFVPSMLKTAIGKVPEVDQFEKDDAELTNELKSRYSLLENIYWSNKVSDLVEIVCYINSK